MLRTTNNASCQYFSYSYSYSATGGTRTRTRIWLPIEYEYEYEYRFTEYEYDFGTSDTGDQRDFCFSRLMDSRNMNPCI